MLVRGADRKCVRPSAGSCEKATRRCRRARAQACRSSGRSRSARSRPVACTCPPAASFGLPSGAPPALSRHVASRVNFVLLPSHLARDCTGMKCGVSLNSTCLPGRGAHAHRRRPACVGLRTALDRLLVPPAPTSKLLECLVSFCVHPANSRSASCPLLACKPL